MAEEESGLSKTILIIKSQPQSLSAVEAFLRNREWQVKSSTNLTEALTYVVQTPPSFVLISVDHTNKRVRTLPKILVQAYSGCIIVFAEQSSTASYRLLLDSGCDYKINPPLTGPAIERTVNKYMRDQQRNDIQAKAAKNGVTGAPGQPSDYDGNNANGVMTFKHDSGSAQGSSKVKVSDHLLKMLSSLPQDEDNADPTVLGENENADSKSSDSKPKSSSGPMFMNTDEQKSGSLTGPAYRPETDSGSVAGQVSGSKSGSLSQPAYQPDADSEGAAGRVSGPKSGSLSQPAYQPDSDSGSGAGHLKGAKAGSLSQPAYQPDSESGSESSAGQLSGSKKANNVLIGREVDDSAGGKPGDLSTDDPNTIKVGGGFKHKGQSRNNDSIIVKGAQKALEESVAVGSGKVEQKLESSTHVACIVIESTRFSGYLVAAMGKNRRMDAQFIDGIQKKLLKFLSDNGEKVENEESLNLKIKPVDFEDWSLEYAEFLRKSVHNGDEVAMAFFPRAEAKTAVGESASEEMASVKMSDISSDVPLEFNLYMYMPLNKKYILYTPKGSQLYDHQKKRLEGQGVQEMHMLKSEVQDLSRFRAQNYLNDLIDDQAAKKKKPA